MRTDEKILTRAFTFFLFSLPFGIGIGTEAPFRTFRLIVRAWL
jgi:hypothetical protein